VNRTDTYGFSLRLQSEEAKPVTAFKDGRGHLARRVAMRTVLGMDIELYRNDFATLAAELEASPRSHPPRSHPVLEWGKLAAVSLLFGATGHDEARRCLRAYEEDPRSPGGTSIDEIDDMALAVATLVGDDKAAALARSRCMQRRLEGPWFATPELMFLSTHARDDAYDPEVLEFSALRGIETGIMVKDTPAGAVCAFGGAAGKETSDRLRGALGRFDELAGLRHEQPSYLEPERIEVPSGDKRIRLVVKAIGPTTLRLDVLRCSALIEELPWTLASL